MRRHGWLINRRFISRRRAKTRQNLRRDCGGESVQDLFTRRLAARIVARSLRHNSGGRFFLRRRQLLGNGLVCDRFDRRLACVRGLFFLFLLGRLGGIWGAEQVGEEIPVIGSHRRVVCPVRMVIEMPRFGSNLLKREVAQTRSRGCFFIISSTARGFALRYLPTVTERSLQVGALVSR